MSVTRDVQQSLIDGMERPVGPILPSVFQGTNADLMAAVAPYYLTGSVLDVTYGEGKWWDRFRPDPFTFHDLYKVDGVDFRALPEADATVDTVTFDPPYVISGGISTGSALAVGFQNRYGIGDHNIALMGRRNGRIGNDLMHDFLLDGLTEVLRVARCYALVKCMEFAQGGGVTSTIGRDFHDTPFLMTKWALELGWIKHDCIVHHTGSGPGGHNIWEAKRARRHHSYLLVFTPSRLRVNERADRWDREGTQ